MFHYRCCFLNSKSRCIFFIAETTDKVGTCPAEVVDERTLKKRFEEMNSAPTMCDIHAYQDTYRFIHVIIDYYPLKMEDRQPTGTPMKNTYKYGFYEGKLVMMRRTKSKH